MNAAGDPGCTVNGNWVITNASMTVLAQMSSAAFGNSDAANFCLNAVAAANFNTSSPKCVNNQVTFTDASSLATSWNWNFGAGASAGAGAGAGAEVRVQMRCRLVQRCGGVAEVQRC